MQDVRRGLIIELHPKGVVSHLMALRPRLGLCGRPCLGQGRLVALGRLSRDLGRQEPLELAKRVLLRVLGAGHVSAKDIKVVYRSDWNKDKARAR